MKMDSKTLYFKNSSPDKPVIEIPIARATYLQNHIFTNCDTFTPKVTKREIKKMFIDAVGKPTSFSISDSMYVVRDEGFLLKLTKKS